MLEKFFLIKNELFTFYFSKKKILELLALLETKLFKKKTHDEKKKSTKFLRKIPKEDKIWKEKKRNDPKQTNNN